MRKTRRSAIGEPGTRFAFEYVIELHLPRSTIIQTKPAIALYAQSFPRPFFLSLCNSCYNDTIIHSLEYTLHLSIPRPATSIRDSTHANGLCRAVSDLTAHTIARLAEPLATLRFHIKEYICVSISLAFAGRLFEDLGSCFFRLSQFLHSLSPEVG